MSAFSDLIEGLRGLFRARWRPATGGDWADVSCGDVLVVLCAQLGSRWLRAAPDLARVTLPCGAAALARVEPGDAGERFVVRLGLDGACPRAITTSRATPRAWSWPRGRRLGPVSFEGDAVALAVLLDPDARRLLPGVLDGSRLRLRDSVVEIPVEDCDDWPGLVVRARDAVVVLGAIAAIRGDPATRLLERAVSDVEVEVRAHAARLLAASAEVAVYPRFLLLSLLRGRNVDVVEAAARALPAGAQGHLPAIASDTCLEDEIRLRAALCLCRLDDPPTGPLVACLGLPGPLVAELAPALLDLPDPSLRDRTLEALRRALRSRLGANVWGATRAALLTALRRQGEGLADEVIATWRDSTMDDLFAVELGEVLVERGRADLAGGAASHLLTLLRQPAIAGRARITGLLGRVDPSAVDDRQLASLLGTRSARVWTSALELAVALDRPRILGDVASFPEWMSTTAAEHAIALLGQVGGTGAERLLVGILLRQDSQEVVRAAVVALGRAGTLGAVEPLLELERLGGGMASEARLSIEQIQQRLGKAGRGGLSLADDGGEAGRLSVAAPLEGGLALADGGAGGDGPRQGTGDGVQQSR